MQLFKSQWLHEDRRDARPYAHRGPRFGLRYGTRSAREAQAAPRNAQVVHTTFAGEREREILRLIAHYDRAA